MEIIDGFNQEQSSNKLAPIKSALENVIKSGNGDLLEIGLAGLYEEQDDAAASNTIVEIKECEIGCRFRSLETILQK